MPPLGQVSVRAELVTQHRDATLVAIALQLYRRQHGMWPSELDALVPSLLPRVPRDRFDGGSIKYILRDGDPVLYVVGTDRDDDHGRTPPPTNVDMTTGWVVASSSHSVWFEGDWVLWPPAEPSPLGPPDREGPIYMFRRH